MIQTIMGSMFWFTFFRDDIFWAKRSVRCLFSDSNKLFVFDIIRVNSISILQRIVYKSANIYKILFIWQLFVMISFDVISCFTGKGP